MTSICQQLSRLRILTTSLILTCALVLSMQGQAQARTKHAPYIGNFENCLEFGGAFGYAGSVHDNNAEHNGFTFSLDFGYRFTNWVGLYIEQDLGGVIPNNRNYPIFYGATMLDAKFVYTLGPFELGGKLGIGTVYVSDRKLEENATWFGLRLGIGATYFVASSVGIGLNFDYTPSFNTDDHTSHFLRLQFHALYVF